MILIINICKEKLHEFEFVKPIENILRDNNIKYFVKHYKNANDKDINKSDKIIICGTSLKDNDFLENVNKFEWLKDFEKPVFGICGGAHIIGLIFGYKIRKEQEIGLKKIVIKDFLGINGEKNVYHLHNLRVLPELWKHKTEPIYATLFHPEVRNKEVIVNFAKI